MEDEGQVDPKLAELRWAFQTFRDQCVWTRACFDTYRDLFGSGAARHEVMKRTAGSFFKELNTILLENYYLQVCKLTDPAWSGRRTDRTANLTVKRLGEMLAELGLLSEQITKCAEAMHSYREIIEPARNKSISHADYETALTYVELGKHNLQEALAFLDYMHGYCDAVSEAIGVAPLDFTSSSGPGDVSDLFHALNGGTWVPPSAPFGNPS